MKATVAALYIDERGPYASMPGVDAWGVTRDATRYVGSDPVVAHPPCGPWGRLRHMSKRPADAQLFEYAVEAVHACGGVLEHPAGSKAFDAYGLPKPGDPPNECGGYTIEVSQVEWGHAARKKTWLYLVRVPREAFETPPFPGRPPTHMISRDAERAKRNGYTLKRTSSRMNLLTPPLFAEYLVRLARAAAEARKVA